MSKLLTVRGLHKTYSGMDVPAVKNVSFSLLPGEVVALIGHNGAGKSTLFDLIAGMQRPDEGRVLRQIAPEDFGWCPQREIIDWSLTVRQNIELGLSFRNGSFRGVKKQAQEICGVLGLEKVINRQAETISGGELRRCQIARAIVGSPRLMVLDEPTTGLDPDAVKRVFEHFRESAQSGASVLISTHDTSRFAEYCTRVVAIKAGSILADMSTEEFLSSTPGSSDLWDGYRALIKESVE
ncbi:ABC transporter ATP-binding protein [Streptomyces sp. NPDC001212]